MPLKTKYIDFYNSTGHDGDAKKRGSEMEKVDLAFDAYEKGMQAKLDELTLISALFVACKNWLKKKAGKKSTDMFGGVRETLVRRQMHIGNLAQECLDVILELKPEKVGIVTFDRRKIQTLSRARADLDLRAPRATELGKGYKRERESYLSSNKQFAIAGSFIHEQMKSQKKFKKKQFESLSLAEFREIEELANKGQYDSRVQYLKKAQRIEYMAFPKAGLLCNAAGNPIDAYFDGIWDKTVKEPWPYAMDSYGNIFVKRATTTSKDSYFNHSSFNAGREVISAGEVVIAKGRLELVNNNSGHYKPDRKALTLCVQMLQLDSVDLSGTTVQLMTFPPGVKKRVENYTVHAFLNNQLPTTTEDVPLDKK